MRKTTVMIPTYNERENIGQLITEILDLKIPGNTLHVLVVDDNSPDGTSQAVAEIAARNPLVRIMTRIKRRGRGTAGIDGFRDALANGSDFVVEMDADFSHHPRYLPALIAAVEKGADVALGSRFVNGGADNDRGLYRQSVTKLAGVYTRKLLQLNIRDVSSGFRCFSRQALESIDLDNLISTGPSIVLEILFKCAAKGMKIIEVPIVFIDRRVGTTKLNWVILLETLVMVLRLRDLKGRNQLFPPDQPQPHP
jgi:dolichol-phosphate mannosyltransferase